LKRREPRVRLSTPAARKTIWIRSHLLATFRRLPDRWQEVVLEEIDNLEQNRLVQIIVEEEPVEEAAAPKAAS
jgi:hypothetical protein